MKPVVFAVLDIAIHAADRDFSGGECFLGAVGEFHHKTELIVDRQGVSLLAGDRGDELHVFSNRQAV